MYCVGVRKMEHLRRTEASSVTVKLSPSWRTVLPGGTTKIVALSVTVYSPDTEAMIERRLEEQLGLTGLALLP